MQRRDFLKIARLGADPVKRMPTMFKAVLFLAVPAAMAQFAPRAASRILASAQAVTSWTSGSDPGTESVRRVFRLVQTDTMQETVNTLRSITDGIQISSDQGRKTITVQCTAREAGLAEWLVNELDNSNPSPGGHEYIVPDNGDEATVVLRGIRVGMPISVGAAQDATLHDLREIADAIRLLGDVQRAVAYVPGNALVWRGKVWQTDFALWLLRELADPPAVDWVEPTSNRLEKAMPSAVRLFYFPPAMTVQGLGRIVSVIRSKTRIQRVVALNAVRAIALRGTDIEAAAAERIVEEARQ